MIISYFDGTVNPTCLTDKIFVTSASFYEAPPAGRLCNPFYQGAGGVLCGF